MRIVPGVLLGAGLLLIWMSMWVPHPKPERIRTTWAERTRDALIHAGIKSVTPSALLVASAVLAVLLFMLITGISRAPVIGLAFAAMGAALPVAIVNGRARRRRAALRDVWPEVVDHLASGIRAGMSLPEAVASLSERGPETLRTDFDAFAQDFRATGRFDDSLVRLKDRLADPVADRIIEALRLTREVGGTDLGRLLRTLAAFLRDDARTRGELLARQSWTINAARLACAAPWLVLAMLSTRPAAAEAFNSVTGLLVVCCGGALTVVAYRLMVRLGRLPEEARVLR